MDKKSEGSGPLVGFFSPFSNLSETGRAVMIAKRFTELGGKAVFFSHGGKYEFLAKENNFEIINVKPILTQKEIEEYFKALSFESFSPKTIFSKDWIFKNVKHEIDAFNKTDIKLIVSTNNLTSAISARAVKIPYININPGAGFFALKIPDTLENPFTLLIPQWFKVRFLNWYLVRTRMFLKTINSVAQKVGVRPFKSVFELYDGDVTLVTNVLDFINIFPGQQDFPAENYTGVILIDELFEKKAASEEIDTELKRHLEKPGRSILVSLGSSGTKDLFIKILKTLNKTNYNVIAIYTFVLDDKYLPKLNDNILLKKFVPSFSKVVDKVDLAIIHGGQGTVFSTVYSKKPIIGFPMHMEQHINLEKIVGHGSGLMLSRKYFSEKKLLRAINKIFGNYDEYLKNAQNLATKLPKPDGDKKAAEKILEIVSKI